MPRETLKALAIAVRSFLKDGTTQAELAKAIGWTQGDFSQRLARLERGDSVDWDTAERLARAIGYDLKLVPQKVPEK